MPIRQYMKVWFEGDLAAFSRRQNNSHVDSWFDYDFCGRRESLVCFTSTIISERGQDRQEKFCEGTAFGLSWLWLIEELFRRYSVKQFHFPLSLCSHGIDTPIKPPVFLMGLRKTMKVPKSSCHKAETLCLWETLWCVRPYVEHKRKKKRKRTSIMYL